MPYNKDKMARNEEKTYANVHNALETLIMEKGYENISVSEIISRSGVARSTFYAHYKCKDDVLIGLCDHIFEHVFSSNLSKEKGHDFSSVPAFDYRHIVVHTFYHFKEDEELIGAIFSSSASHIFVEALKKKAYPLIEAIYLSSSFMEGAPKEVAVSVLLNSFISLLSAFTTSERKESAENMADYFFKLAYGK
ncbi:MAG: TetR/AcrR family transcriptional regulator, partial [Bacilli bacterium]|nr:TetR/AcrR family transcriptional regulator [Bacilli bacterium]